MIEKVFARYLGNSLIVLTLAGFLLPKRRKRFLGIMNVDTAHSVLRIPLTAALLYVAQNGDLKLTRSVLLGVGAFYLGMGVAGMTDRRVGGMLPSELTTFDIAYHFSVGAAAIWLGSRSGRMMKP